jgi:hypothetical protein
MSVTLLAMIVALIPPPGTSDVWLHEAKVAGGSFLLVLIGLVIYRARRIAGVISDRWKELFWNDHSLITDHHSLDALQARAVRISTLDRRNPRSK